MLGLKEGEIPKCIHLFIFIVQVLVLCLKCVVKTHHKTVRVYSNSMTNFRRFLECVFREVMQEIIIILKKYRMHTNEWWVDSMFSFLLVFQREQSISRLSNQLRIFTN